MLKLTNTRLEVVADTCFFPFLRASALLIIAVGYNMHTVSHASSSTIVGAYLHLAVFPPASLTVLLFFSV